MTELGREVCLVEVREPCGKFPIITGDKGALRFTERGHTSGLVPLDGEAVSFHHRSLCMKRREAGPFGGLPGSKGKVRGNLSGAKKGGLMAHASQHFRRQGIVPDVLAKTKCIS